MDGFDTMTMSYLAASPLSLSNLQAADYLAAMPGMDLPDQRSNFETETFIRYVRPVAPSPLPPSLPPATSDEGTATVT
jgi:hypothetical protein